MMNRARSLRSLAGLALAGGLVLALPAAPAAAADSLVTTIGGLQSSLADCSSAPNTITLDADIVDAAAILTIACDTVIDLGVHDLTVRNIVIEPGVELEVTGPTDGSEGTLTADASMNNFLAAISTTAATFTVTGGVVNAFAGINASAIGGDLAESAGTLNVAGGAVSAHAYPVAYGTAVGGGYLSGDGGTVVVSSGSLYAIAASTFGVAIGGGGAGVGGEGGGGANVAVSGGILTAVALGTASTAIGGGVSGLDSSDKGGAGGSLTIGEAGEVVASSPRSAYGGGWSNVSDANFGSFGSVQVDGVLRLPSGALGIYSDPLVGDEIVVGATGQILGDPANPAVGATIVGTGSVSNQGVIALNPPSELVSGNNRLVTFDTGDPAVRVFGPSFAAGYRVLPSAPAGEQWNTAADGSGSWFTSASSTSGFGPLPLFSVAPAELVVSTVPADLIATAGVPFAFPVTVNGPTGVPLVPQPAVDFTSADCVIGAGSIFTQAGICTIAASTTVEGAVIQTSFEIEVVAGAAASLTVTPSAMSVAQGGTLTFSVTGLDAYGNPVDASAAVLTSSVATDVVDGHSVTFPRASPHTITATLGDASQSVTVQVIPPVAPDALPRTGASGEAVAGIGAGALVLMLVGGALVAGRIRRARSSS